MKNKFILIIFVFFLIFSFALPSFCFGFSFNYNNNVIDFGDDKTIYEYFFIFCVDGVKFDLNSCVEMPIINSSNQIIFKKGVDMSRYVYYPSSNIFAVNVCSRYTQDTNVFSLGLLSYDNVDYSLVYSSFDIKDKDGNIIFEKNKDMPFIVNKEQIETGKFDKVILNAADYTNNELYLLTYYFSENTDNPMDSLYPRKEIQLKLLNNYYVGTQNEKAIYEVPLSNTGIDLKER